MNEASGQLERPLFTNGDLCRLIIPLVIEQLLICTVGMADTAMISFLGETCVAGVTLIDQLNNALFHCFTALATGGAVVASQFLGARNRQAACGSASQLLGVNLGLSFLLLLMVLLGCDVIVHGLFGTLEPEVFASARLYFRITALSFPFFAIYCSCAALFRSQNQSQLSLYSCLLGNAVNVLGNWVLIYVLGWGVAGAAWATVASRGLSMLLMLALLFRRENAIHLSWGGGWHWDWPCVRRILHIGIPNAVESGTFQFGRVIVVAVIAAFGSSQLAANAVANNLDYLGCLCGNAFCLAAITVIGQAVGRGDVAVVRHYVRKIMVWACTCQVVWNLFLFALMPWLMGFYTLSEETYWLAVKLILIHNGVGMLIWPWSFVFPNVLRAANDVRYMMFLGVGSMLIVRVGVSYVIGGIHGFGLGALGVWYAMVLDWVVRIAGCVPRYLRGRWQVLMRGA